MGTGGIANRLTGETHTLDEPVTAFTPGWPDSEAFQLPGGEGLIAATAVAR